MVSKWMAKLTKILLPSAVAKASRVAGALVPASAYSSHITLK